MTKTCSFSACDRPHRAHGLCSTHYRQQSAGRTLRPVGWRPAPPKCSVDGCPGDARSLGMCPAHYARMHRHGTTDLKVRPEVTHCRQGHEWTPENTAETPDGYRACRQCQRDRAATYKARLRAGKVVVRAEKVPCSAPGCDRLGTARTGLCRAHYEQQRRGETLRPIVPRYSTTHCRNGHELTPENLCFDSAGRRCLTCRRAASRATRARKREQAGLPEATPRTPSPRPRKAAKPKPKAAKPPEPATPTNLPKGWFTPTIAKPSTHPATSGTTFDKEILVHPNSAAQLRAALRSLARHGQLDLADMIGLGEVAA